MVSWVGVFQSAVHTKRYTAREIDTHCLPQCLGFGSQTGPFCVHGFIHEILDTGVSHRDTFDFVKVSNRIDNKWEI
jgi:hypothetical protein